MKAIKIPLDEQQIALMKNIAERRKLNGMDK